MVRSDETGNPEGQQQGAKLGRSRNKPPELRPPPYAENLIHAWRITRPNRRHPINPDFPSPTSCRSCSVVVLLRCLGAVPTLTTYSFFNCSQVGKTTPPRWTGLAERPRRFTLSIGLLLLILTVVGALAFDFLNGFHDAANSIATVVSTRVLSPKFAILWAAFFNFAAASLLGTAVAKTIGKGMIRLAIVTQYVVIAGLVGAIVWDLLTWWWGLPTSSSHALIGGYAGAAIARAAFVLGPTHSLDVILPGGWTKTLTFIVLSPVIGLAIGWILMTWRICVGDSNPTGTAFDRTTV